MVARLRARRARARQRSRSSASGTARSATTTRTSPRCPMVDWPAVSRTLRRVAGLHLERVLHADRAARLDRRVLRRACRASTPCSSISRATPGATSRSATCASAPSPAKSVPRRCRTRSIPSTSRTPKATSGSPTRCCHHFAAKLPISRWQRDLTDSTGVAQCRSCARARPDRLECAARAVSAQDRRRSETIAQDIDTRPRSARRKRCKPRCAAAGVAERRTSCSRISRAARRWMRPALARLHRQTTAARTTERAPAQDTCAGSEYLGLAADMARVNLELVRGDNAAVAAYQSDLPLIPLAMIVTHQSAIQHTLSGRLSRNIR